MKCKSELERNIRILKECLKKMRDTNEPSVYYSCYNTALAKVAEIILVNEKTLVNGKFASEIHTDLFVNMNKNHNQFIDKMFKQKMEDNLVYQMWDYVHFVEDEAQERLARHLRNIKKKYHFCRVRFKDGGILYTYITKDVSIRGQDIVVIKQGNNEKFARVMEVFNTTLSEIDVPVLELGCVNRKFCKK